MTISQYQFLSHCSKEVGLTAGPVGVMVVYELYVINFESLTVWGAARWFCKSFVWEPTLWSWPDTRWDHVRCRCFEGWWCSTIETCSPLHHLGHVPSSKRLVEPAEQWDKSIVKRGETACASSVHVMLFLGVARVVAPPCSSPCAWWGSG